MRAFGKTNVIGRKDMYPYYIIGDIDLYSIFIMLGIIAAVIVYRLCADRANINAKLYNFTLICALCSIVSGFVFSVLFQAISKQETVSPSVRLSNIFFPTVSVISYKFIG